MDSLTQITLGAAVGEAVAGKQAGKRAMLWGGFLGTLPDLDVLITPFYSEVDALIIHRGFSHSILFTLLATPLFGWLISRFGDKADSNCTRKRWSLMAFLVIGTHILLDSFTNYGTQVFNPFSHYPVAFNSIFIIDPLYTLPMLFSLIGAAILKNRATGWNLNKWGLIISSSYLLLTLGVKAYVHQQFTHALEENNIAYERLMTAPSPFNILLWTGFADNNETVHVGLFSILDDNEPQRFQAVSKNPELIDDYRDDTPVQRLLWFSRGFYSVTQNPQTGKLYFHDLRFGRSDLWLTGSAPFSWSYELVMDENRNQVTTFDQSDPSFNMDREILAMFWKRMLGEKPGEAKFTSTTK